MNLKASDVFLKYEGYVNTLNEIIQNVKANNYQATKFGAGVIADVITNGTLAIDEMNDLRVNCYLATGVVVTFAAYSNTAANNLKCRRPLPDDIGTTIATLQDEYNEILQDMIDTITADALLLLCSDTEVYAASFDGFVVTNLLTYITDVQAAVVFDPITLTNTVRNLITGTAQDGQTLTNTPGTWTGDAPIVLSRQWVLADDATGTNQANIGGQTGLTYVVVVGDIGKFISVVETAVEGGFDPQTATARAVYTGVVIA